MSRQRSQRAPRPAGIGSAVIVYEDDHLLVADKPAGVSVTADRSDARRTLHDAVLDHVRSNADDSMRVRPINLLDRHVSGLVVFAKSKRVESALESLFRRNRVRRTYSAVVQGSFDAGEGATGTVQSAASDNRPRQKRRDAPASPPTPAVTHYRVIRQSDSAALVQLRPETHRRDQLIHHMRQLGCPIIGDQPQHSRAKPQPLLLHLEQIVFEHPRTGRDVRVSAPRPESFARAFPERDATHTEAAPEQAAPTSWQPVAKWYSEYQSTQKSDHFSDVIHPGALKLLGDVAGRRVLDVACGEGSFASLLTERGSTVAGIDAAPDLIEAANAKRLNGATFAVGDASRLDDVGASMQGPFDAASCIMALMNIEHLDATLAGIDARLAPGAPFVAVMLHPAFRSPRQTSWGWDTTGRGAHRQYRRVDAYLSESSTPITMNPGKAAHGASPVETVTFHRPLSVYVRALASAGFVIDAIEEWPSRRTSEPGPRADEENRARAEIPLFLGIRALKSERTG